MLIRAAHRRLKRTRFRAELRGGLLQRAKEGVELRRNARLTLDGLFLERVNLCAQGFEELAIFLSEFFFTRLKRGVCDFRDLAEETGERRF